MIEPIDSRISLERSRAKIHTMEEFRELVDKKSRGAKSREILRDILNYEGYTSVAFLLFDAPPVVAKARGATVWDVDGNEYIDLIGAFSSANAGHCNPKITEAIKRQCEEIVVYSEMPNEPRLELAKELIGLAPGRARKKVHFTVTGSEAVDLSTKLARYYTGRPDVFAFHGAYHGRTYGSMNATTNPLHRYHQGQPFGLGMVHVPYPYCYRCPFGKEYGDCNLQCMSYIEEHFRNPLYGERWVDGDVNHVAAILAESMLGAGGYIVPPKEFLPELRRIADEYRVLLILDEIQVGFGRTGKWWACQHYDVEPDIMTISKSLGGGLPMSATISKAEIQDYVGPGFHCTTFAGYPLACAAALATIRVMKEERLLEHAASVGDYFLSGLKDISKNHRSVAWADGKGLYIGLELVKDRKTKEPAKQEARTLQHRCYERGLLFLVEGHHGNIVKAMPPLVLEKSQVDKALQILDEELTEVERKL